MVRAAKLAFRITPEVYIWLAVMLLTIPLPWICAWILAAAVHEFGHFLALSLCGIKIEAMEIGLNGVKIYTAQISDWKTLLCSLAGPIGGIFCMLLVRHFPRFALCALMQSAFNLLPVYPLDGGRAIGSATRLMFSQRLSETICTIVEAAIHTLILIVGAVTSFWLNLGLVPFVLGVFFVVHTKKIKIPCK